MTGLISQAVQFLHERDPREEIWDEVGEFVDFARIGGADVLIAVYKPGLDRKTRGGIIIADRTADEYDFQGVAGLVLKLGPYAYQSEKTKRWFVDKDGEPQPPQVNDWVMFDIRSSIAFKLGKRTCRFVNDQHIMTPIPSPDAVA